MPWNNQNGGGWKSGGSGGGGGGGGGGPWGQGPWGQGGGGGNQPDLEDILKRGQDRLKQVMPGGGIGGGWIALAALLALGAWAASGIYLVRPNERAVNLVFGKYVGEYGEGLRYNWPIPLGQVIKVPFTEVKLTQVGSTAAPGRGRAPVGSSRDNLMLTGDGNIVEIAFDVQWQVDATRVRDFVFNLKSPEETVRAVAESAMREVVGRRDLVPVLNDRAPLAADAQKLIQETLNVYGAGVSIVSLQLNVSPPSDVVEAFRGVPAAQQEQVRLQNLAEAYRNRVVPEAKGQAAKLVQEGEAYRLRSVAEAQGQASRFSQILEEYKRAPDVTRQRLYIETMERVHSVVEKTIIDGKVGQGGAVLPYLSLDRRPNVPAAPAPAGQPQQGATR